MRFPLVTATRRDREVAEAKRLTRRNLIGHLRRNSRGLVLLDQSYVVDSQLPGPLSVLGDGCIVTNCYFRGADPVDPAVVVTS